MEKICSIDTSISTPENGYLDIPHHAHPEIPSDMNHSHNFANEVQEPEDVLFIISDVSQLSIQPAGLFKN